MSLIELFGSETKSQLALECERGLMDEQFVLTAEDAEAVIRERGPRSLADPALFNIAILDYLLGTDSPDADIMITALARLDADSTRFLQSYLSSGASRDALVMVQQ